MGKTIIGIDPGAHGFVCVTDNETTVYFSIADNTRSGLAQFFKDIASRPGEKIAVMEEVHALFGASAKSTFNFGEIFGFLQGLIVANGLPYALVQPKTWQTEVWISPDKVFKSGKTIDTKKTSINAAMRLFPDADFRRTPDCKNIDDNKVDATLIAEYARRKNL